MPKNCYYKVRTSIFHCRRLKRVIEETISRVGKESDTEYKVVLAGLSNIYTHYITTFEEYQLQRYEAASTIYGPHTLRAYIEEFDNLTEKILTVTTENDVISNYKSQRLKIIFSN